MEYKYPFNILFLIPAITAAVFFILAFNKKEKIMAALHLADRLKNKILRAALLTLALCLMVFALMGPQVFLGNVEVGKSGLDIYVLVDTSKSMLVSDITPNRITLSKKIIENLLDSLDSDRIGFIPFASSAYIQMPLTDDYQLARMFLNVIDTDMISGGGTNLAAAIRLASDSFKRTSGADRVVLILSDGEENDGEGQKILNSIEDDQLRIYTMGIGTEKGGPVPIYSDDGKTLVDYMKDESGNPVISRLNSGVLQALAGGGKGSYYQASQQGGVTASLLRGLSNLKRDTMAVERIRQFQQMFQYFLGAGILLFLIAWFLPDRRRVKVFASA